MTEIINLNYNHMEAITSLKNVNTETLCQVDGYLNAYNVEMINGIEQRDGDSINTEAIIHLDENDRIVAIEPYASDVDGNVRFYNRIAGKGVNELHEKFEHIDVQF